MIPLNKVKDLILKHKTLEKELSAGTLHKPIIADLEVKRELKFITSPGRYSSRAANAFRKDVLPVFASEDSPMKDPNKMKWIKSA